MKYRVIVNGVSFFTTGRQINAGVGSDSSINVAVMVAKKMLGKSNGVATTIPVYDQRMTRQSFAVQIDKM